MPRGSRVLHRVARRALAALLLFLLPLPAARASDAADLYGLAERAFGQGLYSAAADSLRQLLRDYPDDELDDEADYLLALCRVYAGGYADAARSLEQFGRRYPGSPSLKAVSYWLGYSRYQLGQLKEAIAAFRVQADTYPGETQYRLYSLSYLAELYDRSGDSASALKASDDLLAGGAEGELAAHALYRIGSIRLKLKDYARAQAAFARIRLEQGGSALAAEALFYEAESLLALGETGEAARRYQAFIDTAGRGAARNLLEQAYLRLARLAAASGDGDRTLELTLRLEAEFPSSALLPEALGLKAETLFDRGDLREARVAYAAALKGVRDAAERQRLSFNMALCAAALGDAAGALASLDEVARGPDAGLSAKSRYRQAVIYADQGSPGKSIPILQALVTAGRADEETLRFLGGLLDDADRPRDARGVWTQLVTRYPQSSMRPRYLYRRASASLALEDNAAALDDFNRLIREFGASRDAVELVAEAQYSVGFVYSSRGEYVRSLPYYADALARAKGAELRLRCLYAQGVAAYNTEDFARAAASFSAVATESQDRLGRGRGLLGLGKARLRTDDAAGAADALERAAAELDGTEEGAESLYWVGVSRSRLGQNSAAGDAFFRIATRYPSSGRLPDALVRAGVAARLAGDLGSSRDRLQAALTALGSADRSSTREEAMYELGITLLAQGDAALARRTFSDLSRAFPGTALAAEGYLRIAQASFSEGRYRDAVTEFSAVSRDFPASAAAASAAFWVAESALRSGDTERAATGYWDYLRRYPGASYAAAAESGVADIVAKTEDQGLLRRLYDMAEADTGVSPALRNRLRLEYALALYGRASYREADGVAKRIEADELPETERGEAQLLDARLLRRLGQTRAAVDELRAISESRTDRVGAEALLELGETLIGSGQGEEGAAELLRLSVLYAQHKDLVPLALWEAMKALRESGDADGASRLEARLKNEFPSWSPDR